MKLKKSLPQKARGKSSPPTGKAAGKASDAYGDKIPICVNIGCALRKKAKCFGFEGCPGFKAR